MYEYCVMFDVYPEEPHRGPYHENPLRPWTEQECREWIREGEEEDGIRVGAFYVARRYVGPWHLTWTSEEESDALESQGC